MNALTQMLSSHVFSTFVPANDCSLFNFLHFSFLFPYLRWSMSCHSMSFHWDSRFFVCSRRFSTTISSSGPRLSCSKSVVTWEKNRKSKRFVQSQSKNTRNITKYTEMYWDIQKYDEMWWNMTSTVSNFIVWTGKQRLTPSTTIRWGHSHLLSVSLKAKKEKNGKFKKFTKFWRTELVPFPLATLATLATLAVAICRFRSATFFHFVRQLGVDTNASATDIRRAYFQKSRQVASVSCQESIRLKQIEAVSRLKYWRNLVKKSWKIKEHTVSREVPWMRQCHPDKTADEDAKVSMTWVWRECEIILCIYNVSHDYAFMIHDHII